MSTRAEGAESRLRAHLIRALERVPASRRYWVAYSGGMDSSVLLHALVAVRSRVPGDLLAVHIHHGLHASADDWTRHCKEACDALGIALHVHAVDAHPATGESPEAAARDARYAAFATLMREGDCLLTAHHQDDQAETVLLQLLRGCGPHGLAGMPRIDRFADGLHARPLLDMQREEVYAYAAAAKMRWIDDPSNTDTRLRRNFLRHDVIPKMKTVWPSLARTLSRSAEHCAASAEMLDEQGADDLSRALGTTPAMLSVTELESLSSARGNNLLRHWLQRLGLPLPSTAQLERLRRDVLGARPDAMPLLEWRGAEVRRYRGWLHAMEPLAKPDSTRRVRWSDLNEPLALPSGGGHLVAQPRRGAGLRTAIIPEEGLTVRFRRGGERCRPRGRGQSHPIKKLLQESALPPWLRWRVPLLYLGDELAAVAGVCTDERYAAGPDEEGVVIEWVQKATAGYRERRM